MVSLFPMNSSIKAHTIFYKYICYIIKKNFCLFFCKFIWNGKVKLSGKSCISRLLYLFNSIP